VRAYGRGAYVIRLRGYFMLLICTLCRRSAATTLDAMLFCRAMLRAARGRQKSARAARRKRCAALRGARRCVMAAARLRSARSAVAWRCRCCEAACAQRCCAVRRCVCSANAIARQRGAARAGKHTRARRCCLAQIDDMPQQRAPRARVHASGDMPGWQQMRVYAAVATRRCLRRLMSV